MPTLHAPWCQPENYLARFGREGEASKQPATFKLPQKTPHAEHVSFLKRSRNICKAIKKLLSTT